MWKWLAPLMAVSLLGCNGDKGDSAAGGGEDSADPDAAFVPDLPTAGCGMPGYDWLSTEGMGTVLEFDDQDSLSLTADGINSLLGSFDDTADLVPVSNGVEVYYMRYQTQDRGQAVEATGMVVLPDSDAGLETAPVILWLHPTVGLSDACAPTATGIEGAAFPIVFAAMGFIVVAPDYLGMAGYGDPSEMTHPYIVAEPTAVASLDALRALDDLGEKTSLPVAPDRDRLVTWGASQGGHAALWTERYLPHYAPHYTAVATVAAIPPTDLPALATDGVQNIGPTALGLAAAQVTMSRWYQTDAPLTEVFVEDVIAPLEQIVAEECSDFSAVEDISSVEELYAAPYIEGLQAGSYEPWSCFLEESTLRTTAVPHDSDTPILMIVAEDDDLALAAPARSDAAALCEQGYRIEYVECAGAGHVDGALQTIKRQIGWVQARVAGETWDPSLVCEISPPEDCTAP